LTKEDRAKLALEKRQKEVEEQRRKQEEERRQQEEFQRRAMEEARQSGELNYLFICIFISVVSVVNNLTFANRVWSRSTRLL
jgi:hypothetical protein